MKLTIVKESDTLKPKCSKCGGSGRIEPCRPNGIHDKYDDARLCPSYDACLGSWCPFQTKCPTCNGTGLKEA
jgi:hypothetical protein